MITPGEEGRAQAPVACLEALAAECLLQIGEPQGDDPYISACNAAMLEMLQGTSELSNKFRLPFLAAFETRGTDLSPLHANRVALRALQRIALWKLRDSDYPNSYADSPRWSRLIQGVLDDEAFYFQFSQDILSKRVQTNVADRGAGIKLLSLLTAERWADNGLRILEIGCGQSHVLKKLVLNSLMEGELGFKYQTVQAMQANPSRGRNLELNPYMTERLNQMLDVGHVVIVSAVGVDKLPPAATDDAREWIASQFYPSEYVAPTMGEGLALYEVAGPETVRFMQCDVTDPDQQQLEELLAESPFDIVMFGTMLYQLDERGRQTAEKLAKHLVNPERGIVVYQDFIDVNPDDSTRLTLCNWGPYQYRTVIEDMSGGKGKQVLFVWDGGRCKALQVGDATLQQGQREVTAKYLLNS